MRTCELCPNVYADTTKRFCAPCRTKERSCKECGKAIRTAGALTCYACDVKLKPAHPCIKCGTDITGSRQVCVKCRATDRTCTECAKDFKGTQRRCDTCKSKDTHICLACGNQTTDNHTLCNPCRWEAQDYETRNTGAIARTNKRRAIKMDAEIFGPVSPEIYRELRKGSCVYCGDPGTEVDHVRPLARGGWECEANLVSACSPCNHSKNDRLLTEWDADKVAYGIAVSDRVAYEWERLNLGEDVRPRAKRGGIAVKLPESVT
jgi:5-methylcytosine-specific restriction endonuclease McrA